ncbi:MAG: SDR family NAD(P)-dependent oxidoreductase [Pseudomonadota bacterium]
MQMLVIGATRGIGLACLRRAVADGHQVRAYARSAAALSQESPLVEPVAADALDGEALAAALEGVDAVIQATGLPINRATLTRPVDFHSRSTAVMLEAMGAAGIRRLVSVTGFGAGSSRGAMSLLERTGHDLILGRIYADKTRQEALIEESALDWTIARATILTNGKAKGRYKVLTDAAKWRNGLISRADVADFMVRAAAEGTYLRETPVITY